ncbi:putative ferric-chelate reductase 1 homolog [Diaphorina citri]|uniref:Ferric-chelate reductase 1 homolog n=1 Tax=Diaphorina citri TaxID=121845 RepID=A0A1S4EDM0_DIACI|nr:putative ferric-chelate reductase 1 homolog [Diaphorina citri]
MDKLSLLLFIFLRCLNPNLGYKAGAPTFACKTMTPGHGVPTQTSASPYTIQTGAEEVDDAGRILVTLSSPPLQFFTGFLVQARTPESDEAIGSFVQIPRNTQLLNCGTQANSSVTQSTNARKTNIEMEWESPPDYEGSVTFVATMVKDYKTFWVAQESSPVQVFRRSVDIETAGPEQNGGQLSQAAQGQRNLELSAYKSCGKTKKCLGSPDGCIAGKTCVALVTIAPQGRDFQIEMFGKKSKYIAIGFSDDTKMGGDHVVECVNEDLSRGTIVKAYRSFNIPNAKQNRRFDDQEGVELLEGSFYDGDLYCKVNHVAKIAVQDKEYDLNNNEYHLLLAAGSALKPFTVGFHDVAYTSTKDRSRVSELKASRSNDPFYTECNKLKSCFGSPEGCVDSQSCTAVASVRVEGTRHTFELKAENAAYVAVGLSHDNKMGGDSVMECVREETGGGSIKAYNSWNIANDKANKRIGVDGINLLNSSSVDGSIYCKFTRDPVHRIEGTLFDMAKDQYFLLLASGSSLKDNSVGFHDQVFTSTAQQRLLADVGAFSTATKLYIRLHGAFMIAAWIGAASIGIVMARYYKQTWIGSSLCSKDIWFAWHRTLMFLTWLLTIAGAVLIFYDVGGWVSGPSQTHALVGVVTTVLCFIQPIAAALRPLPGSSKRPLFNWLHWLVGNVAHICAIVTIFLAVQLSKAELPEFVDWILVAFVAFYVAIHLILSCSGCLSDSKAEKRINAFPMKQMSPGRNSMHTDYAERKRDAPYAGLRKTTLCLHCLVILAITVALVLIVVLAPIEKQWGDMKDKLMT